MRAAATMDAPTPPRRPSRGSSALRQAAARRRRQRPAWLVAFALSVHLWAPGLCLAQMLSAASPGQICTAAPPPGRAAADSLPGGQAGQHALEGCDQCVASFAAAAPDPAPAADLLPRADAPRALPAPLRVASRTAWRPPPRGPPLSA